MEQLNLKDVDRRIFIKKIVKFIPLIGVGSLIYPASKIISESKDGSKFAKIMLSSLEFDVNVISDFFIVKKNNEFIAFSSSCTHLGCRLIYDVLQQKFICPCHKSEFLLNGKVIKGPAKRDLDIAKVSVKNNELTVVL